MKHLHSHLYLHFRTHVSALKKIHLILFEFDKIWFHLPTRLISNKENWMESDWANTKAVHARAQSRKFDKKRKNEKFPSQRNIFIFLAETFVVFLSFNRSSSHHHVLLEINNVFTQPNESLTINANQTTYATQCNYHNSTKLNACYWNSQPQCNFAAQISTIYLHNLDCTAGFTFSLCLSNIHDPRHPSSEWNVGLNGVFFGEKYNKRSKTGKSSKKSVHICCLFKMFSESFNNFYGSVKRWRRGLTGKVLPKTGKTALFLKPIFKCALLI